MPRKFGNEDVKRLVDLASQALNEEDEYLRACFEERRWMHSERGPGICDNLNERYYQFIIWRRLMKLFEWRSRTERQDYDLVFYDNTTNERVGCAEIKGWWSESGKTELTGIMRDLRGKLGIAPFPGVMIILTCHEQGDATDNLDWLAEELNLKRADMVTRSFPVAPGPGDEGNWEFAIIGLLVNPLRHGGR